MDIQEFTKKFEEVFDNEVSLTPDTYFKELDQYGSMTVLSIIAFVDSNFDIEISAEDIRQIDTVSDLYDFINNYD